MTAEYVQVVPSTDGYDHEAVAELLTSVRASGTTPEEPGLLARLFGGEVPVTFEFLALCAGGDAPVEFFYGADGMDTTTLQTELRNCYPRHVEVSTTDIDPLGRLVPHVEYDPPSFLRAARNDALWADPDVETPSEIVTDEAAIGAIEAALDPAPATADRTTLAATDGPVYTADDTVLARPATDDLQPVGLRWHGVGEHRRDWMCPLTPPGEITDGRPPLATLIDHLGEATIPLAFQVVFRARRPWDALRTSRVSDIRRGTDTRLGQVATAVREIVQGDRVEKRDPEELPERTQRRLSAIQSVDASTTFDATVRALTLQVDTDAGTPCMDATDRTDPTDSRPSGLQRLRSALGPLAGDFYELTPRPIREEGLLQRRRERTARRALDRLLDGELYTDDAGRSRPHVVATPEALAGLVTVPSGDQLSVPASRATRTTDRSQTPLPRPSPDQLASFREGMTIGRAVDDTGDPEDEPLRLPPAALTRHYARYGPTGWGKSKAVQRDVLSLYQTTGGPTVLIDRKGAGMIENYMRAHYAAVGDLSDVYHLQIPDVLPAIPFFDLRPGLAAGRDRQTVIQEKVEHFREILRMVMGEEVFEQAFVANEILTFLIRALFDPTYQSDAYGLDDLYDAALRMQQERTIPAVSTAFRDTANALKRQFEKDHRSFQRSMDAVLNRLDKLRENSHLAAILGRTPDWDADAEAYEPGTFDFRRLFDEDCVVLLDLGHLRKQSSRALILLLLSNLWDALQYRTQTRDRPIDLQRDGMVNVIVEEAAPLSASRLVQEDLLPQGRAFGLGLGLVMQFPEQVISAGADVEAGRRAVRELGNNVGTQIVGGITVKDEFGSTLVGDDLDVSTLRRRCNTLPMGQWLVDLPETEYLEPPPGLVSMQSLPILPGHPESEQPLSDVQEQAFTDRLETVQRRSRTAFGARARHVEDRESHPTGEPETDLRTRMARRLDADPDHPVERLDDPVSNATPIDEEPGHGDTVEQPPEGFLEQTDSLVENDADGDGENEDADDDAGASDDDHSDGGTDPEDTQDPPRDTQEETHESAHGDTQDPPQETQADTHRESQEDTHPDTQDPHEDTQEPPQGDESAGDRTATAPEPASDDDPGDDPDGTASQPATIESRSSHGTATDDPSTDDGEGREETRGQDQKQDLGEDQNRSQGQNRDTEADHDGGKERAQDHNRDRDEEQEQDHTQSQDEEQEQDHTQSQDEEQEQDHDRDQAEGSPRERLLERVLAAMHGDLGEYALHEDMRDLVDVDGVDVAELLDDGLLERHRLGDREYYTVTPQGCRHVDETPTTGAGVDDLVEKTPHRVGVTLLCDWLDAKPSVDQVHAYHEHDGVVYDVAAEADGSLVWVGEVQTRATDPASIVEDYHKLADVDASAVWAVPDRSTAQVLITALVNADLAPAVPVGEDAETMVRLRETVADWDRDCDGMDTLLSYRHCREES